MSALAIYFEREGIASVVIGLVKPHLEKVEPPRAMWVPFELGRPLGAYAYYEENTRAEPGSFQKTVLRQALALLERTDGPVILEDFSEEDPGRAPDPNWVPPYLTKSTSIIDEMQQLEGQWRESCNRLGRSMVGLSKLPIEQAADYLQRFDTEDPAPNPDTEMSDVLRMRFCADDVRTYFAEAALAKGTPSSKQIGEWFWGKTYTAELLKSIRQNNLEHENSTRAAVCGRSLVPGAWLNYP